MEIVSELLPDTWLLKLRRQADLRGTFVKCYSHTVAATRLQALNLKEEYYSTSKAGVIRGMHFQTPPHDHLKVVYCPVGLVLDVLLDLRKGASYGRTASVILGQDDPCLIWIPPGVAHGFRAISDDSLMIYKTTSEHAPAHDMGIRWDSFGFDWGLSFPIVSARDAAHPAFPDFVSPF